MSSYPNRDPKPYGAVVRNVHPCDAGRQHDGIVTQTGADEGANPGGYLTVAVGIGSTVYGPAENWAPLADARPPRWLELADDTLEQLARCGVQPARIDAMRRSRDTLRAALAKVTKLRKVTRIEFCERHAPWFSTSNRARKIECMVEGGPGGWTPGCSGGTCRLWPGTDYFEPAVCTSELELEWTKP